jgi:hypothetical protein
MSTLLVVTEPGGDTHLAAVELDNPAYQRDPETILTGFEVLSATNA